MTPEALRAQYRARKAELMRSIAAGGASTRGVRQALTKLSNLADESLRGLWQACGFGGQIALIAAGGFGRAELFPHSDVDVLLLLPDDVSPDADPVLKGQIETFVSHCWDAGLEIGSSVRTVAECLAESAKDVTVQTALLEARLIVGNAKTFAEFQRKFKAAMDPQAFFVAKTLELRQRHNKFENTPYSLEPNCKESPGGLRDLQVILWVAQASDLGRSWDELARNGLATSFEVRQIKRNEALLKLIRLRLHITSQRREDRLVFDLQTAVAATFGYESVAADGTHLPVRASEALMRRYYWAAKAVTQLNQILLLNIEERLNPQTHEPRPINENFFDKAGMIEVASDDLYQRNPHAILETFLVYQTTVGLKGLSARTLRALYNARGLMDGKFRNDPVNRATFRQILMQHDGITHAMRLMNQTSVLGRYLWVFRRIVGQMQHDLFHVYTVDQHILMVLRNVRRFFMAEHAHEYPFCSQLGAGWDKPFILYAAALFHDIAKGRGGDHSVLGTMDARRFCKQHQIERDDARLIEFLVQEHLTMSRIAQKSDLSDPDVIAAFAQRVGSERNLTALYLLTVADIRGTSPKVWNAWKGKLLEDLYRYTLRVLGGRAPDADAEVELRKREALVLVALHSLPFEAHKPLWDTLDVGYFMRHEAVDIAWHTTQLSRYVGSAKPIVRARRSPVGEGLRCWSTRRISPICSRAFAATLTSAPSAFRTRAFTPPKTVTRWTRSKSSHKPTRMNTASSPACWSMSWPRPSLPTARCPRPARAVCRAASRASPSHRASACAPTKNPNAGCSTSQPATASACSTASPAYSRATTSICSSPKSPLWASGLTIRFWSTAPRYSRTRRRSRSRRNCWRRWQRESVETE